MPITNVQDFINEISKHGMTLNVYSYIYVALAAFVSSALGVYFGAYLKKRGEEKAIQANFKTLLKRIEKTTSLTEEIKASVGISTLEYQIRFSKLHEKRIDIIEGLYHRLTKMEKSCRDFLIYNGPTNDIGDHFYKAQEDISDFINYSKLNKFWVDEKLFNEIENVALRIDKIVHKGLFHCNIDPLDGQAFKKAIEENKAAVDEINKEIPKAKENIISSIRKVLDPKTT